MGAADRAGQQVKKVSLARNGERDFVCFLPVGVPDASG